MEMNDSLKSIILFVSESIQQIINVYRSEGKVSRHYGR